MIFPVRKRLRPPEDWPATLCVVIDTEEEFDWSKPFDQKSTQTGNIDFQPLAQTIFDRYGIVPAYVIDYPVASSPMAGAVLRSFLDAGRCEIGAHLHPWVNPPHGGPIDNFHSFPGNLPAHLESEKLAELSQIIETNFGHRPSIYKAGRYGIGRNTAKALSSLGFKIDVSVVPFTSFQPYGGPDFGAYPDCPFETENGIVAMPLSVTFTGILASAGPKIYPALSGRTAKHLHLAGILSRLGLLERLRLSPEGHTLDDLIRQTSSAFNQGQRLFMLTYHSSSLLPGATMYVQNEAGRDKFLSTIEKYIEHFFKYFSGRTASVSKLAEELTALSKSEDA